MTEITVIILSITAYLLVYGIYQKKAIKIQTQEYIEQMRKVNGKK